MPYRLAVVLLFAFAVHSLAFDGGEQPESSSETYEFALPKVCTLAEFKRAVLDKTPAQIVKLLGQSYSCRYPKGAPGPESNDFSGTFAYREPTITVIDPKSGKPLRLIVIGFGKGKSRSVLSLSLSGVSTSSKWRY